MLRDTFASFAASHPNPVIADELWQYVGHIEKADLS